MQSDSHWVPLVPGTVLGLAFNSVGLTGQRKDQEGLFGKSYSYGILYIGTESGLLKAWD